MLSISNVWQGSFATAKNQIIECNDNTAIMFNATTCGTHFGETKLVVSITGSPD